MTIQSTIQSRSTINGIRIAIIDDHPSVREGLRALLEREGGFQVCGEAGNVADAIQMISNTSPSVAIVDISLGSDNSLDLIRRLMTSNKALRILAWSMFDELLYAERALAAGAMGFINKQEATREIFAAIRKVMSGEVYDSQKMANHIMHRSVGGRTQMKETTFESLSNRELEVFRMIGAGSTTAEISRNLHLSVKTVETHRQRIKDKLQIGDAPKLVREATQWVLENG